MRIQFFSSESFHMTNGRSRTASGGNPEITRFARLKTTIYIFFWNGNIPHLHLLHYICKITMATPLGKTRENCGKQWQFRMYVVASNLVPSGNWITYRNVNIVVELLTWVSVLEKEQNNRVPLINKLRTKWQTYVLNQQHYKQFQYFKTAYIELSKTCNCICYILVSYES